ncbi:MAG: hypothetical protein AAF468_11545 [Pseudomonadota bacterium]
MANHQKSEDEARLEESRRILRGVDRDSETVGRSTLARTAQQASDHMLAEDKSSDDSIEVWGTRIGRILSLIAFVALAIWLFNFLGRPAS